MENEGTYITAIPTADLWNSVVATCAYLCTVYSLDPQVASVSHHDYGSAECPGDALYAELPQLRNDVAAQLGSTTRTQDRLLHLHTDLPVRAPLRSTTARHRSRANSGPGHTPARRRLIAPATSHAFPYIAAYSAAPGDVPNRCMMPARAASRPRSARRRAPPPATAHQSPGVPRPPRAGPPRRRRRKPYPRKMHKFTTVFSMWIAVRPVGVHLSACGQRPAQVRSPATRGVLARYMQILSPRFLAEFARPVLFVTS